MKIDVISPKAYLLLYFTCNLLKCTGKLIKNLCFAVKKQVVELKTEGMKPTGKLEKVF